jgi:hypothetical protein
VARDYFAQADDGSVWYFGEDVDNYEDGVLADHDGTWLAGRDGPPGMIMPARPAVGDVYRPENIPGRVFEEVTVRKVDRTVPGPRGRVAGAVVVEEELEDGTRELKTFAPGYGEFRARVASSDELVNVAVAVPIDATSAPMPPALALLATTASEALDAVRAQDWTAAEARVDAARAVWRAGNPADFPPRLGAQLEHELATLGKAVASRRPLAAGHGALELTTAVLDLQLLYRPVDAVDCDRLAALERRATLDASADPGGAAGDAVATATIRERLPAPAIC